MNLQNLKLLFAENGCQKIYVKSLAPNDNSKNQIYLGGSFEILNILPLSDVQAVAAGDWTRERFKATINFSWIGEDGNLYPAPQSQLILYPKYPEVRFSGFLARCDNPPSHIMTQRLANRLLFLSVAENGIVLGYAASPNSVIAREFFKEMNLIEFGVFKIIELPQAINSKQKLIKELRRIHNSKWITSKKLDSNGNICKCEASQCGGFTLEAELGIKPNSRAEPDFLGWEIKQFGVKKFENMNSSIITLFTPEPTDGFYITNGVEAFIRKYGYDDKRGRVDRKNFGGIHKVDLRHEQTKLKMELIGYDKSTGKIRNSEGKIALIDERENIAASWDFASLLKHWNKKHDKACYVPSIKIMEPRRKYRYGNKIILGTGTDFPLFLRGMACGNIYYDPGIKMENASSKPKIKRRSQFRIKTSGLNYLYKENEIVTL